MTSSEGMEAIGGKSRKWRVVLPRRARQLELSRQWSGVHHYQLKNPNTSTANHKVLSED